MNRNLFLRLPVLLLLVGAGLATAQTVTSTLTGKITDSSGAVIAHATVTIRDTSTGKTMTVETGDNGEYLATNLTPATYEITITAPGFRTGDVHNADLLLNATLRNDVSLTVGSANQKIEVSAAPPVISTDTSAVATLIDMKASSQLPLNGRTVDRLILFTAGNTSDSASAPKLGGSMHWGGSYFTVDGGTYNDLGNGQGAYSYATNLTTMPSTEVIQEMKVESSLTKAEYEGGANISILTKSGSNVLHGSLYEFNRNRFVAARDYFARVGVLPKPQFNRNEFGGTIGGPIWKDRTFFFASAEALLQRQGATYTQSVATDLERAGNFSGLPTIKDPNTGIPFPNNTIPAIDPRAAALLAFYPHTNQVGTGVAGTVNNLVQSVGTKYDVQRYTFKIDHTLNARNQLTLGGSYSDGNPYFVALGTPANYGNFASAGYYTQSIFLRDTTTVSKSMINEARYGYFSHRSIRVGQNPNFDPSTIFPGLYGPFTIGGVPTVNISGYTKLGDYGGSGHSPETTQQLTDNFTWARGAHTFKTGINININAIAAKRGTNSTVLGTFSTDGRYTGNAFADFLLGYIISSTRAEPTLADYIKYQQYGMYAQDDWRVNNRLTLNLGFRYNLQTEFQEQSGDFTNFDFITGKFVIRSSGGKLPAAAANSPALPLYPYTTSEADGWGSDVFTTDKKDLGPRFGFAFRPFSTDTTVLRGGYGIYYNFTPAYIGPNQLAQTNFPFSLNQTYSTTSSTTPTLTFANPFPGTGTITANPTIYAVNRDLKNLRAQQWNLTVEQVLAKGYGLRVSYVANKSTQDPWYLYNKNLPAVQQAATTLQSIRPYQPWGDILTLVSHGAGFTNQMQVSLTKRTSYGLFFQTSYTWNKSLDNVPLAASPQNPYRPQDDRGYADGIRLQNFFLSATYDLPFKGEGLKGGLISGWSLATMTQAKSGVPFTPTITANAVGWYANRANVVPGVNPYAGAKTKAEWFNPAAFSVPAPFTFGNARRNSLFGPDLVTSDISVLKMIHYREKYGLQLRFDAFNALNHPNFSTPASNISVAGAGVISGTTSYGSNRQVQLGGKFTF